MAGCLRGRRRLGPACVGASRSLCASTAEQHGGGKRGAARSAWGHWPCNLPRLNELCSWVPPGSSWWQAALTLACAYRMAGSSVPAGCGHCSAHAAEDIAARTRYVLQRGLQAKAAAQAFVWRFLDAAHRRLPQPLLSLLSITSITSLQ